MSRGRRIPSKSIGACIGPVQTLRRGHPDPPNPTITSLTRTRQGRGIPAIQALRVKMGIGGTGPHTPLRITVRQSAGARSRTHPSPCRGSLEDRRKAQVVGLSPQHNGVNCSRRPSAKSGQERPPTVDVVKSVSRNGQAGPPWMVPTQSALPFYNPHPYSTRTVSPVYPGVTPNKARRTPCRKTRHGSPAGTVHHDTQGRHRTVQAGPLGGDSGR